MKPADALKLKLDLQHWWATPQAKAYEEDSRWGGPKGLGDSEISLCELEATILSRAETFWVSREMTDLTELAAASMPRQGLRQSDLPCRYGFVIFDRSVSTGRTDEGVSFKAVAWHPATVDRTDGTRGEGVRMSFYMDVGQQPFIGHGLGLLHVMAWAYGASYELSLDADPQSPALTSDSVHSTIDVARRFFAAFWALIQQPLAITSAPTFTRPERRQYQRIGQYEEAQKIKVITLRKPRQRAEIDHDPESVEWSHRWMVDGHWRNQWMPSLNDHRLIWIHPFVKGPENKPLVLKDKVYAWKK